MLDKIAKRLHEPSMVLRDVRKWRNKLMQPDVVDVRGVKVPLGPHISADIRNYIYAGTYECDEAAVLQRKLRSTDVVVELGGGIGFMSALCCKVVDPRHVHIYEANRNLEPAIRRLYELNGVAPDLNMCALGVEEGAMEFIVSDNFWDSSAFAASASAPKETLRVPVKAFAAEAARYPRPPTFLIVDIEGGEYDFFLGVELPSVERILCEVHEAILGRDKLAKLLDNLQSKGFRRDEQLCGERVWYLEKQAK